MRKKNLFKLFEKILLSIFILIISINISIATAKCIQCVGGTEVCPGAGGTPDCTAADNSWGNLYSFVYEIPEGEQVYSFGTLTIPNNIFLRFMRDSNSATSGGGGAGGEGGSGHGGKNGEDGEHGADSLKGTGRGTKGGVWVKIVANTVNMYGYIWNIGEEGGDGVTVPKAPESSGGFCTGSDTEYGGDCADYYDDNYWCQEDSGGAGGGGGGKVIIDTACMNIDATASISVAGNSGGDGGDGEGDTDECGCPYCWGYGEPGGAGGGGGGGDGGVIEITVTDPICSNLDTYTLTHYESGGSGGAGGTGGTDSESGGGNSANGVAGSSGSAGTYTLNYQACNSGDFDSSNSYFVIKNAAGTEIAKIDQNGMMVIDGGLKSWSTGYDSTHDFLIKNSGGTVVSWIDDATGDLYLSGSVKAITGDSPSSSGNFVIKDNGGNSVAWFKDNGDLYLKSCLGSI